MICRKFQVFGLLIVTTSVIIFFCDKDFGHELENGKISNENPIRRLLFKWLQIRWQLHNRPLKFTK